MTSMAFRMSDFPSPDKMSLLDNVQIDVYTWRGRLKPSLECEIEKDLAPIVTVFLITVILPLWLYAATYIIFCAH